MSGWVLYDAASTVYVDGKALVALMGETVGEVSEPEEEDAAEAEDEKETMVEDLRWRNVGCG
jgi:hypothetical protein